jgi:hypothetical protein
MNIGQQGSVGVSALTCWQVTSNRRYLRVFEVAGYRWTAVLSWYGEQECGPTAPTAFWLLRLGPGTPCNLDVPVVVVRTVRFLPADLDRSTPSPRWLQADAETMDVQHALQTAERFIETELRGQFASLRA